MVDFKDGFGNNFGLPVPAVIQKSKIQNLNIKIGL